MDVIFSEDFISFVVFALVVGGIFRKKITALIKKGK